MYVLLWLVADFLSRISAADHVAVEIVSGALAFSVW